MSGALQGIEQLKKQLEALDKKLRNKIIKKGLRIGAKRIAKAVKVRAPRDTGKLAKSVRVRAGKRKKDVLSIRVVITGGHETPMVGAIEYGTKDQAPRPFIRPGFDAEKGPALDDMIAEIAAGLK